MAKAQAGGKGIDLVNAGCDYTAKPFFPGNLLAIIRRPLKGQWKQIRYGKILKRVAFRS